ncbi:MAG: hypothetical protein KIT18_01830 [Burkholderiales bacterium]|nr:hypothetical protein [Burkholderiales bacterium]
MNLFVNGYDIVVTNDCHSIHLPMQEVRTGGQRTAFWKRIYWSAHYTGISSESITGVMPCGPG